LIGDSGVVFHPCFFYPLSVYIFPKEKNPPAVIQTKCFRFFTGDKATGQRPGFGQYNPGLPEIRQRFLQSMEKAIPEYQ
jgi:hypothetical protein